MRAHRSRILNGSATVLLLLATVGFWTSTAVIACGVACLVAAGLVIAAMGRG